MGSVTFSGFNNIDFGYILNQIMEQERLPVRLLEAQRASLQGQQSAFSTLASKLTALETAARTLGDATRFGGKTVTSSNPSALAASGGTGAVAGTYDVVVQELARAQVTATANTVPDKDASAVASGGSLVINGVAITVTVPATLQDLADAINQNADVGVTATVVSPTPGQYKLVLTGKSQGTSGAFTVENQLTGADPGAALVFTDTDGDGTSGDSAADNAVSATDALVSVNNVQVTATSNTLADVIPGVTLTLLKKDPAATITVGVAPDQAAGKAQVKAFVQAFNDLASWVKTQAGAATSGDRNSIGRDSLLRGLNYQLRSDLTRSFAVGGTYQYLSEVGIGFDRSGQLTFDEARFDEVTKNGTDQVLKLFAGGNGTDGAFKVVETLVTEYTQAGGLIPDARERLGTQLTAIGKRIDGLEARLALRRDALSKEFTAADQAMSQLNSSLSSLQALGGQYRLF